MVNSSIFASPSSEQRWVHQANKSVLEQVSLNIPHPPPICIFHVPKFIVDSKPKAYIPERIGLGPYHHFRGKTQKMMREKLAAVKQVLTKSQIENFQSLVVDKLKELEPNIRACYEEYLDVDGDTLAWIMAIDGVYLLCRLGYSLTWNPKFRRAASIAQHDNMQNGTLDSQATSSPSVKSRDYVANSSVGSTIIEEEIEAMESPLSWRDLVKIPQDVVLNPKVLLMLENQIPFFVLKVIQDSIKLSSDGHSLDQMLASFAEANSPLELLPSGKLHDVCPAHLLDFMYFLVVSNLKPTNEDEDQFCKQQEHSNSKFERFVTFLNNVTQFVNDKLANYTPKPLQEFKNAVLLGASAETLITGTSGNGGSKVEEINIPSVSEICEVAKVTISVTPGGIRDIDFDENKLVFYLPAITLRSNSDVVLRNLAAYEQAFLPKGSTLELTEYIELMCGIVDTDKDAEILRKLGIIKGDLGHKDVVNIFNEIPRYKHKPAHKSNLRRSAIKLRKRFDSRPMVKWCRFIKKQMIIWWKVLVTVSTLVVVLLVIYKQVCDFYGCNAHIFGKSLNHPLIKRPFMTDKAFKYSGM